MNTESKTIKKYVDKYNLPHENVKYEWVKYDDSSLFFQLFSPTHPLERKKTVLFLHGFFDHTGTNAALIWHLLNQGYSVAAFDLPGHGLSGGERFKVDSFQQYQNALESILKTLRKRGITELHGVGHSTGGAILADYLLTSGPAPFKKVCLISPLIRSNQWWVSKLSTPLVSLFRDELPRRFRMNSGNTAFMKKLKADPLQGKIISLKWVDAMFEWEKQLKAKAPINHNILILQGTEDQTVDWKHNLEAYLKLFPRAKRMLVDEGSHHLINERKEQRTVVYDLIIKYLTD
ncbi:alpha/beta hydrolase [Alteribacillus sp. YIM 98480]|uniref:alpha/beta hydrolase n=1 Tax=Alteribacillus sp. YIM 98480 TaxID=2606599 RepID=UPI00131C9BC0|nr:alpha/beta hydrolase [Alteribacillus sp. YIM 98480]